MAMKSGRGQSWWLHEMGDQMVHGTLASHSMRRVESGIGLDLIGHPEALLDIVAYASESAVISHRAICSMLSLDYDERLDQKLSAIEKLQAPDSTPSNEAKGT